MSFDLPEKKRDSFTSILRFMDKADITLSAEDERILSRWIFCDVLLREKKHSEEDIINKIVDQFTVSKYTARNDIGFAQKLFAKVRAAQKKYLIALHLDRIDRDIEHLRKRMFEKIKVEDSAEEFYPSLDAKELAALAKFHEVYTYTLNSIPEEAERTPLQPPIFQFILPPGVDIQKPMDTKSALLAADEYLTPDKDGIYKSDNDK